MIASPSFGVCLAGVPVLMPAGTALEFVAQAPLHPLPLAPSCVAGLMQLRGQPVVVFDGSTARSSTQRAYAGHDVLVIGKLPQAAALLVDGPPQAVPGATSTAVLPIDRSGALAHCVFADALTAHRSDPGGGEAGWYEVDPMRLFEALARA